MKVFIVGSKRCLDKAEDTSLFEQRKRQFASACRALGAAFAGKNHTIVVGVPDWSTLRECSSVANSIIEGANKEPTKGGKKHSVIFFVPRDHEPPDTTNDTVDSMAEIRRYDNIDLDERVLPGRGDYPIRSIPKIADVDAIVLIGGANSTAIIGQAAFALDKPCIAVTSLGGAAQDLFEDILGEDQKRFVSSGDLKASHVPWRDDNGGKDNDIFQENKQSAEKIVNLAGKLVRANNLGRMWPSGTLAATLVSVALLLLVWLLLFIEFPKYLGLRPIDRPVTFFSLLYASALLGAGLRILTAYKEDTSTQVTFTWLFLEAVVALLVAYGLALLYLIGGISFVGKVVVFDQPETDAFNISSVTWSLIGLGAGFLLPIDQLRERLGKTVSDKEK